MAMSNLVNINEEYIKDAIVDGIDADAVNSTLEDVMNRSDELGKTPSQVKEVIETIVDMKKDNTDVIDEQYASDFVKKNGTKISSALNDGISPDEIANTLVNSTNNSNTKKEKEDLKFTVKLITKMKKKELRLKKNKENIRVKGYQKVLK